MYDIYFNTHMGTAEPTWEEFVIWGATASITAKNTKENVTETSRILKNMADRA